MSAGLGLPRRGEFKESDTPQFNAPPGGFHESKRAERREELHRPQAPVHQAPAKQPILRGIASSASSITSSSAAASAAPPSRAAPERSSGEDKSSQSCITSFFATCWDLISRFFAALFCCSANSPKKS